MVTDYAAPPRTLEQWLDALIEAAPDERRMVSIDGLEQAGIALERVTCVLHDAHLNWLSAFDHLNRTEATHRLHHGPGSRLHKPGDLRPAAPVRPTSRCKRCGGQVIWASTMSGGAMPVDAEPDPAGSVVLTASPDSDRPLAIVLYTDQASAPPDARHTPHAQSCVSGRRRASRRSSS